MSSNSNEDEISFDGEIGGGVTIPETENHEEMSQQIEELNQDEVNEHTSSDEGGGEDDEVGNEHEGEEPAEGSDEVVSVIVPGDEMKLDLYCKLFFGESKDDVVSRITKRQPDVEEKTAARFYERLVKSFSGSGEHLVSQDYLSIIEELYSVEELYRYFSEGVKEELVLQGLDFSSNEEDATDVLHDRILRLYPQLREHIVSLNNEEE